MTCKNWNSLKAYMVLTLRDPTSSLLHNQLLNFFWTLELGGKKKKTYFLQLICAAKHCIECCFAAVTNKTVDCSFRFMCHLWKFFALYWLQCFANFCIWGMPLWRVSIARQSKLATAKQLSGVKCNLASSIVPLQWPRHAGACATLAPIQLVPKISEAIRCRTSTIAMLV